MPVQFSSHNPDEGPRVHATSLSIPCNISKAIHAGACPWRRLLRDSLLLPLGVVAERESGARRGWQRRQVRINTLPLEGGGAGNPRPTYTGYIKRVTIRVAECCPAGGELADSTSIGPSKALYMRAPS